jgi:hypothetical protein
LLPIGMNTPTCILVSVRPRRILPKDIGGAREAGAALAGSKQAGCQIAGPAPRTGSAGQSVSPVSEAE